MEAAATPRRSCFTEEDEGSAPLVDMEEGFSGNHHHHHLSLLSRPQYYSQRRGSPRNIMPYSSLSSPRSARSYDARHEEQQPYFLESCFLCKKPLADNRDIYMYRGDTPFCSVECREEQMEMDEAKERRWNLSASVKAMRKKERKSTSPSKNEDCPLHSSSIAAA